MSTELYKEDNYDEKAATSGGLFVKIESGGEVRMRIIGNPIKFTKTWEGKTSYRYITRCLVHDKTAKTYTVGVFEFGTTIKNSFVDLKLDDDWGDLEAYDVTISRTGEKLNTKYSVVPKPKAAIKPATLVDEAKAIDLVEIVEKTVAENAERQAESAQDAPPAYDPHSDE